MVTIVTRSGNGAALSTAQMDANLTNLNTKVELDDLSVTTGAGAETSALSYNNSTGVFTFTPVTTGDLTALDDFSVTTAAGAETSALSYNNTTGVFTFTPVTTEDLTALDDFSVTTASASGAGSLSYNNTTGVFTFAPADTSLLPFIETIDEDTSPQLGGNLDVLTHGITTSTTNGDIVLTPNGTGVVKCLNEIDTVSGTVGTSTVNGNLNLNANGTGKVRINSAITHATTDADINIDANGDGLINLNGEVVIQDLTAFAETIETMAPVSGTLSINAADGPIKYVVPSGAMTINGFATPISGQTATLLIDNATNSSNFGVTLGSGLLTPAGDGVTVTDSGYDIVTITCVDATNGLYIVTAVNDFQ